MKAAVKWGKRAEMIVAMDESELLAVADEVDPMTRPPKRSRANGWPVKAKGVPKPGDEFKAAINWLRATAKEGGPNACHARNAEWYMRRSKKALDDYDQFSWVFSDVRRIAVPVMMFLIVDTDYVPTVLPNP